jgi:hypothetical protein
MHDDLINSFAVSVFDNNRHQTRALKKKGTYGRLAGGLAAWLADECDKGSGLRGNPKTSWCLEEAVRRLQGGEGGSRDTPRQTTMVLVAVLLCTLCRGAKLQESKVRLTHRQTDREGHKLLESEVLLPLQWWSV